MATISRGTQQAPHRLPHPANRNDTMLGVCQAIGDELGFNPDWLRIAFGISMFFMPLPTIAIYLGLALIVGGALWRWPMQAASEAPAPTSAEPATTAENDQTPIAHAA